MLDGKKGVAQKIVYGAFAKVEAKSGKPALEVFEEAMNNIMPVLEVKARRIGGATYQVPIEVRPERRQALALRWITTYSRKRGEKTMEDRLANELLDAMNNTGASGKGKGGALLTNIKDLAACTTVPQGTFTVDAAYTITAPGTGFPPPTMESTANEVLCKAITFAGPPPTYTPSDYVFIVRTASGKYAKLKAKSFYDDEGKSGIYSFEYAIQPDGSTNLN